MLIASLISIALSAGSLAWGYSESGFDFLARWLLFFGAAWLLARIRRWWWFSATALIVTVLISSFGIWFGIAPSWMFSAGIFALIAWDLTEFHRRTRFERRGHELDELERRRIARVTLLALAGLCISSTMMLLVRAQFTPQWTLLLAFVFSLGFLQLVTWMRSRR